MTSWATKINEVEDVRGGEMMKIKTNVKAGLKKGYVTTPD